MALTLKAFSKIVKNVLCASKTHRFELGKLLSVEATKKKILEFAGLNCNDEELASFKEEIFINYKKSQLVAFCLMLGLPYDGQKDELADIISNCLNDLTLFYSYQDDNDDDVDDDDDDEELNYKTLDVKEEKKEHIIGILFI